jgi:hypothetical protein
MDNKQNYLHFATPLVMIIIEMQKMGYYATTEWTSEDIAKQLGMAIFGA